MVYMYQSAYTHGNFNGIVKVENRLVIYGKSISILQVINIKRDDTRADYVVESTGIFTTQVLPEGWSQEGHQP